MIFILLKNRLPGARSVTVDFLLLLADFRQEMKGGHSQRRRFSLVKSRRETRTIVRFDKEKKEKINNNLQQALCVVQSPTSEEEPLGSSGHQKCHQTDGSEETAGRCGTPPSNHRQSRRRRPLSTETSMSSSTTKQSGRSLAPPPPAAAPVKSHYKVISTTFFLFPLVFISIPNHLSHPAGPACLCLHRLVLFLAAIAERANAM